MTTLPKEHGGTVMTVGALLAGWGAADAVRLAVPAMVLAIAGLFFGREPALRLLRQGRRLPARTRRAAGRLLAASALLLLVGSAGVLATLPLARLLPLAAVGAPLLGLLAAAGAARRERALWAEAAGVAALALAAPALYLAASGRLDARAWQVYAACLLFFLGATLHLRTLLRDRKAQRRGAEGHPGRAALWSIGSAAAAAVLAALGLLPVGLAGAVGVALLRPLVLRRTVLARPQRVGIAESVLTGLFVVGVVLLGA